MWRERPLFLALIALGLFGGQLLGHLLGRNVRTGRSGHRSGVTTRVRRFHPAAITICIGIVLSVFAFRVTSLGAEEGFGWRFGHQAAETRAAPVEEPSPAPVTVPDGPGGATPRPTESVTAPEPEQPVPVPVPEPPPVEDPVQWEWQDDPVESTPTLESRIADLVQQEAIEIEASGSGIRSVRLRARRASDRPLRVVVPVGTFFTTSGSAQNMVSTDRRTFDLDGDEWVTISVPAACANQSARIPNGGDQFGVRESSNQEDLTRLMRVLESKSVGFETRQAAVWIVTDNATYGEMGTLVWQAFPGALGGSRAIGVRQAVEAMRLCEEAGIDPTSKAIWRSKDRFLEELGPTDSELRSWLEEKAGANR
jgi:hypothetical protein